MDQPIVEDAAATQDTANPSGRSANADGGSGPIRAATDTRPGQNDAMETQGSGASSPDTSAADPVDQPVVDDATAPAALQETANPSEEPSNADQGAVPLGAPETGQLSGEPDDPAEAAIATDVGRAAADSDPVAGDLAAEDADRGAAPDLPGQESGVAQAAVLTGGEIQETSRDSAAETAGHVKAATAAEGVGPAETDSTAPEIVAEAEDVSASVTDGAGPPQHDSEPTVQDHGQATSGAAKDGQGAASSPDSAGKPATDSDEPATIVTEPGPDSAVTSPVDEPIVDDGTDIPSAVDGVETTEPGTISDAAAPDTAADQASDVLDVATDVTPDAPRGADPVNEPVLDETGPVDTLDTGANTPEDPLPNGQTDTTVVDVPTDPVNVPVLDEQVVSDETGESLTTDMRETSSDAPGEVSGDVQDPAQASDATADERQQASSGNGGSSSATAGMLRGGNGSNSSEGPIADSDDDDAGVVENRKTWDAIPESSDLPASMQEDLRELGQDLHGIVDPVDWTNADTDTRKDMLDAANDRIREEYGLPGGDVNYRSDLGEGVFGEYDPATGNISLNSSLLEDSNTDEAIKTLAHENFHDYQQQAIDGNSSDPYAQSRVGDWSQGQSNYDSNDFTAYMLNPLEADSFAVEQAVFRGYRGD